MLAEVMYLTQAMLPTMHDKRANSTVAECCCGCSATVSQAEPPCTFYLNIFSMRLHGQAKLETGLRMVALAIRLCTAVDALVRQRRG